MDYSKTVYLPQTSFPMKGNLPEREPEFLKMWEDKKVYEKLQDKNRDKPLYILHDGPPYANGHIHLGTALNKILKDVVVKYRSMGGFYSPYKPGWDCHGMPIEHQVFKEMKTHKSAVSVPEFRKQAAAYAMKFMDVQRSEFKRLGVLGDWNNPYLTLSLDYEADIVKAFGQLALDGYIYQAYKPIYWCISCETALAEAEIEYEDKKAPAIYVKFSIARGEENASFLIWTTTPWTLPANTAIAVHPELKYVLVETQEGRFILAEKRLEEVMGKKGLKYSIIRTYQGAQLENFQYDNPLVKRRSRVIVADFVSSEDGTGCVHSAPGHGEEDYYAGLKNNLEILSPVDEKGRFTGEVEEFAGQKVFDADTLIIEKLKQTGALFFNEEITHSYPHCWRCKKPVIFRSTRQWFLKVDHNGLRDIINAEIEKTKWVPAEGKNRISSMVGLRPDWCLSRQRLWGVPIPVFYCEACNKPVITKETVEHVEKIIRKNGSDVWMEKPAAELLPEGFTCPFCGNGGKFRKETDILDVWFDSGCSHLAVLKESGGLRWPADLYLEGSDQHRGWFQTSIITSCGIKKQAPYRTVLTHGFVVDAEGRKMSKSLGNVIKPEELIKKYGAEILRLWSVTENYQQDVRISEGIIKNVVMSYRNVRNTLRYLLGNLHDFSPENAVSMENLADVDKWAMEKLKETVNDVTAHYEKFAFNKAYEQLHNYCNLYLSSFYLDHLKDRLYTYGKNSPERRSGQTALYYILNALVRMLAPILSFTAEEAYQLIPWGRGKESVFMEDWPGQETPDKGMLARWERLFEVRKLVLKKIEEQREAKVVGSSLEAKVTISADKETLEFLKSFEGLPGLFIVSEVVLAAGNEIAITVEKTAFGKCARCWVHFPEVDINDPTREICHKCKKALIDDGICN